MQFTSLLPRRLQDDQIVEGFAWWKLPDSDAAELRLKDLTRALRIANVSPCHINYEDTHNTLRLGAEDIRQKHCKS